MSRDEIREFFHKEGLIHLDESPCDKYSLGHDLDEELWKVFRRRAKIPADIVQCPHCRNFTDGRGPLAGRARWTPRRVAALAVGVIAALAFLSMILGGC